MSHVTVFSPAKLNLFLAITGRRSDGFHELVSVVAPLAWGDQLEARRQEPGRAGRFTLECDDTAVPVDGTNLVLKAAGAFVAATGWRGAAHFVLTKRIPLGAGLGGGSSNAVAALRALNELAGQPLDKVALGTLAATLGSDCALFVHGGPVIMRGRGERIEPLTEAECGRLRGRRVLVFKPAFGVATAWAYQKMAARPGSYLPAEEAEARLQAWRQQPGKPLAELLGNNMEAVAFRKFPALPALLADLRERFGLAPRMSGSGSACFALLPDGAPVAAIKAAVREAWGPGSVAIETTLT